MSTPSTTFLVEDFINAKDSDPMTYYNLSILSQSITTDGLLYSSDNIIYTYLDELKSIALTCQLTDNEYEKYKFKPKLFSYDIYGTTELYFVILAINGVCSIKDFDFKTIKAPRPEDLTEMLNNIYTAEESYISYNRSNLGLALPV